MVALTLAYDGTAFAGSQIQPGARTVQSELNRALRALGWNDPRTTFAGRTDRGVHAAGQVVGITDNRPAWTPEQYRKAINAHLPDDVSVVGVERKPSGFHVRYDARWREYRYRIATGPVFPVARGEVWFIPSTHIGIEVMNQACQQLLGEHDLAAFAGGGEGVPWSDRQSRPRGTTRRIIRCRAYAIQPWWCDGRSSKAVEIAIAADGFLPRMVRNIVGTLVEIGRGKQPATIMGAILASRDRRQALGTAPPHGLTLWRVGYDGETPDEAPPPGPDAIEG